MRFLLARMHKAEYRREIEAPGFPKGHQPEEPLTLRCPRCDALYIPDVAPEEEPWDLEACEWAALVRLDGECPDHRALAAVLAHLARLCGALQQTHRTKDRDRSALGLTDDADWRTALAARASHHRQ